MSKRKSFFIRRVIWARDLSYFELLELLRNAFGEQSGIFGVFSDLCDEKERPSYFHLRRSAWNRNREIEFSSTCIAGQYMNVLQKRF